MTEKRPIDANDLMARFFRKECLMQGHSAAASAAYKDAQKTVAAASTVSLWPEWRNPEANPPKVEEDVLILFETACGGYGITTAHYEDGTVLSEKSAFYWEEIFEWGTYDEESDDYFIPKGWWEYRYFNPDDVYNNRVDSPVVGWMPLPPKGGSKKMSEKKLIYADDLYDKVSSMGLQNGSALGHHSSTADAIAEMIQNAPAVDPASCLNWRTGKPPEHESWFAKFKDTEQWRFGMFETMSDEVLVTVEFPGGERYTTTSHTTDGEWLDSYESIGGHIIAWAEMPAPAKEVAKK